MPDRVSLGMTCRNEHRIIDWRTLLSVGSLALLVGGLGCSRSGTSDTTSPRGALRSSTLLAQAPGMNGWPEALQGVPSIQRGPEVKVPVRHRVSPPLRELIRRAPPPPGGSRPPETRFRDPPLPELRITPPETDPAVQTYAPLLDVEPHSFVVLDGPTDHPTNHPDPNVAIGTSQIVQAVNTSITVYDKATGAQIAHFPFKTLFADWQGRCNPDDAATSDYAGGDPIVLYDKLAHRWFFSAMAMHSDGSTNPPTRYFAECIAVSVSDDATLTSQYNEWEYDFGRDENDFPKFGVWSDGLSTSASNSGYYANYNMFPADGSCEYAKECVYERAVMLQGGAQPRLACFNDPNAGLTYCNGISRVNALPSDLDGTTPTPAGAPNYFLQLGSWSSGSTLNLYKFHVDWNNTANSTFTGLPTTISVPSYTTCGNCSQMTDYYVPQPGTTVALDTLYDRLNYRLAYRRFGDHESLVTSHSVQVYSQTSRRWSRGVRWYEIRSPNASPVAFQTGTFAPDMNTSTPNYRWMSSVVMDGAGNIALGYSISNDTSTYPSIRIAGRLAGDTPATLRGEIAVANGTGTLYVADWRTGVGDISRFGDYTCMAVDPTDDRTFVFTSLYITTAQPIAPTVVTKFDANTFAYPLCGSGLVQCGGQCVSLLTDGQNCGTCGTPCPANSTCTGGRCICNGSLTMCDNACVSLATDVDHCGSCPNACPRLRLNTDGLAHGTVSCVNGCCTATCDIPQAGGFSSNPYSWAVHYPYGP